MFTGIITAIGTIRELRAIGDGRDMRLAIGIPGSAAGVALGASIACSGCCLTVIERDADWFAVEVSAESISKTKIGTWREGTRINLERALKVGDELGGHIVSGHVDGTGVLVSRQRENASERLLFEVPSELARFIAPKGSITVDGVALTVNEVHDDEAGSARFGVNIIPYTAEATTLGQLNPEDIVHLEIDMLARYVARLAEFS